MGQVNYDQKWQKSLTLDKFCGLRALEPLKEQNKNLFPVLGDGISAIQAEKMKMSTKTLSSFFIHVSSTHHLRRHVLHYTVEQIEALVVISFGCDEFLEHSKKTRLEEKKKRRKIKK